MATISAAERKLDDVPRGTSGDAKNEEAAKPKTVTLYCTFPNYTLYVKVKTYNWVTTETGRAVKIEVGDKLTVYVRNHRAKLKEEVVPFIRGGFPPETPSKPLYGADFMFDFDLRNLLRSKSKSDNNRARAFLSQMQHRDRVTGFAPTDQMNIYNELGLGMREQVEA